MPTMGNGFSDNAGVLLEYGLTSYNFIPTGQMGSVKKWQFTIRTSVTLDTVKRADVPQHSLKRGF